MEEPGWDAVKKYFRKIMNSFALGMLWMFGAATAGLYFKLAYVEAPLRWPTVVFYAVLMGSLAALLRYYYRLWKD